jgi:hypothetical protein
LAGNRAGPLTVERAAGFPDPAARGFFAGAAAARGAGFNLGRAGAGRFAADLLRDEGGLRDAMPDSS